GDESGLSSASPQPPLFCGSPPRRASNPVVHDSRNFMENLYKRVASYYTRVRSERSNTRSVSG
ncbi:hypothetical protein ACJX0J_016572, partial [Zea mays]